MITLRTGLPGHGMAQADYFDAYLQDLRLVHQRSAERIARDLSSSSSLGSAVADAAMIDRAWNRYLLK